MEGPMEGGSLEGSTVGWQLRPIQPGTGEPAVALELRIETDMAGGEEWKGNQD